MSLLLFQENNVKSYRREEHILSTYNEKHRKQVGQPEEVKEQQDELTLTFKAEDSPDTVLAKVKHLQEKAKKGEKFDQFS